MSHLAPSSVQFLAYAQLTRTFGVTFLQRVGQLLAQSRERPLRAPELLLHRFFCLPQFFELHVLFAQHRNVGVFKVC